MPRFMDGRNDNNAVGTATSPRAVVLVAFDGVNPLDLAGPSTVFATANHRSPGAYKLIHAGLASNDARSESGLVFSGLVPLQNIPGPIDTLILAGGDEAAIRQIATDETFAARLRVLAGNSRRVASVCTGAFLLAAAGLLDGRRAVTHWASCSLLEDLFPAISVERNEIFVRDGKFVTSAGVSAGIDLALALIEEDLGASIANEVAKSLVVYLRRPGGQSQFSTALSAQTRAEGPFSQLVSWIPEHLCEDLSVGALAAHVNMSPRTFHRRFVEWAGQTPANFIRDLRLESARRWLETTSWPIKRVAQEAGFGSVDSLERAFARQFGVTPGALRARFGHQRQ
jgi:transcriptional regulator GlxA family with amidase domain